ncbi:MAG: xanthine dehydrogenase [Chloroflexi bacterium]|nr:xanthine dehydrogenase [Chloroflexota bacterium]
MPQNPLIFIKGAGEIASAAALALHRAGYRVALADDPAPNEARRGMAFADALVEGSAELDGVQAVRWASPDTLDQAPPDVIPVLAGDPTALAAALRPAVLVDARMRKREAPEPQIGEAPLVIGLGPGFRAGVTVHLAVETNRGPNEGAVLTEGETDAYDGRSGAGHVPDGAASRYAHAPAAGAWETALSLGDAVEAGGVLGSVGGVEVQAPMSGTLRGITRTGAPVTQGHRVADVDPWRTPEKARGVTRHSRAIADGVLRAVQERVAAFPA